MYVREWIFNFNIVCVLLNFIIYLNVPNILMSLFFLLNTEVNIMNVAAFKLQRRVGLL